MIKASIKIGKLLVFGITEIKPLSGFPEGRVKIKMRHNNAATAHIKTDNGIRQFFVVEEDGKWTPGPELGANHRIK